MLPAGPTALGEGWSVGFEAPSLSCGAPTPAPLLTSEGVQVGTVTFSSDAQAVYATFRTQDPMAWTGVAMAETPEGLPFRPSGAPIVGSFPSSERLPSDTRTVTWRMPRALAPGQSVVLSAFARVGDEAVWAAGTPIRDRGVTVTGYLVHGAGACDGTPVGSDGGTVTGPEGQVELDLPEGALADPVAITIEPAQTSVPSAIEGTAWEFGPSGITFDAPVRMRIAFDPAALPPGLDRNQLRLANVVNGAAVPVEGSGPVPGENVVEGFVTHFSTWVLIWVPQVDLEVVGPIGFSPPAGVVGAPLEITAGIRHAGGSEPALGARLEFEIGALAILDPSFLPFPPGCVLETPVDPLGGTVACTLDLNPGEVATRTLAIQPTFFIGSSTVQVTARARVPATLWDYDFGNNEVSGSTAVGSATSADVRLLLDPASSLASKGGDRIVVSGEVQYVLAPTEVIEGARFLVEATSLTAGGVIEVDPLPQGCAFAYAPGNTGAMISCAADISAASPGRFEVGVRSVTAPQEIRVTVSAEPPLGLTDPVPSNNAAPARIHTVSPRQNDLGIAYLLADPNPAFQGASVAITMAGENGGPDDLPRSRLRFSTNSGAGLDPAVPLANGCTDVSALHPERIVVECLFDATVGVGSASPPRTVRVIPWLGTTSLQATATYLVPGYAVDADPSNNTETLVLPVFGPADADVSLHLDPVPTLTVAGGDPVRLSGSVRYEAGAPSTLEGAGVEVRLDGPSEPVNLPAACSWQPREGNTGGIIRCTGPVELGSTFPFELDVRATQAPQSLGVEVEAVLPFGFLDRTPADNLETLALGVTPRTTDLYVTAVIADRATAVVGEAVGFTVLSGNDGPDDLPWSRLRLTIPSGASLVTPQPALQQGCVDQSAAGPDAVVVDCHFDAVFAGFAAPTRQILVVPTTGAAELEATATYVAPAIAVDPNPGNNTRALTLPVTEAAPPQADLQTQIAVAHDSPGGAPGELAVVVQVSNQPVPGDPNPATTPATTTFVALHGGILRVEAPEGCVALMTDPPEFLCNVPALAPGQEVTFTFGVEPEPWAEELLVDAETAVPDGIVDPIPGNNHAFWAGPASPGTQAAAHPGPTRWALLPTALPGVLAPAGEDGG